jgi:hypothetical protein
VIKIRHFRNRTYEATLFTSVNSTNAYKESSSKGFSILAGYIFWKQERKITMTSPVSMSLDSSMTMMFMVPKSLKKKRYHNQTDLILNSEKNLQKLWQLYPLVAGLMMKNPSNKQQLIKALDAAENKIYLLFFGINAPLSFNQKKIVD